MASRRTILELLTEGADRVRRDLLGVGKDADRGFDRVQKGSRGASAGLGAVDAASRELQSRARTLSSSLGPLGDVLGNIGPRGLAAGAALAIIGKGFIEVNRAATPFNAAIANLSALTGLVGDDLEVLRESARKLGATTTLSATEVAEGFKIIASAKPELLGSAEALGTVGEAAATLAEAAGLTLPDAARALTTALNQFQADASKAAEFVDILAESARLGAVEIPGLGEALVKSGTAAAASNIPFELLTATIQRLGAFGTPLEQIGTGLRNIFTRLQTGAADTNPEIVGLTTALDNLAGKQLSVEELTKRFGLENVNLVRQLIETRGASADLAIDIQRQGAAAELAARNTDTYEGDVKRLKNAFTDLAIEIAGNQGVLRDLTQLLTDATRGATNLAAGINRIPEAIRGLDSLSFIGLSTLAGFALGGPGGAGVGFLAASAGELESALGGVKRGADDAVTGITTLDSDVNALLLTLGEAAQASQNLSGAVSEPTAEMIAFAEAIQKARSEQINLDAAVIKSAQSFNLLVNATGAVAVETDAETTARRKAVEEATKQIAALEREAEIRAAGVAAGKSQAAIERDVAAAKLVSSGASATQAERIQELTAFIEEQNEAQARGIKLDKDRRAAAEKASQQSAKDRETAEKAIAAAERAADVAERRRDAAELSTEALDQFNNTLAVENALLSVGVALTDEQALALARYTQRATEADGATEDLTESRAQAAREAEEQSRQLERQAEEAERALQKPFDNAIENIQRNFADMFTEIFRNGRLEVGDFADFLKDTLARAAGELVTLRLVGAVQGIAAGQEGAAGGGLSFGSLSDGAGLLKTLSGGLDSLGGGVLDLLSGVDSLTGGVLNLTTVVEGALPATGVGPGAPATALGAGAGVLGAAAGVVVAALVANAFSEGLDASKFARTQADRLDAVRKSINDLGIIGTLSFGGDLAEAIFSRDASVRSRAQAASLTVGLSEIARLFLKDVIQPKTGGSLDRKSQEEFLEEVTEIFRGNDFRRGLGQELARSLGGGEVTRGSLLAARDQSAASIGLDADQTRQFAAFDAILRAKLPEGENPLRNLALQVDFLANLEAKGASAADAIKALAEAFPELASPIEGFRLLAESFERGTLTAEDYAEAVQGLADLVFTDLPVGVDASALALEEFARDGAVDVEKLTKRIADVAEGAVLLADTIRNLAQVSRLDLGLSDDDLFREFGRALFEQVRDSTIAGITEAILTADLDALVLEPFFRDRRELLEQRAAGEITTDDVLAGLKVSAKELIDNFELFKPIILETISAVRQLEVAFEDLERQTGELARRQRTVLDDIEAALDQEILGIRDPRAAAIAAEDASLRELEERILSQTEIPQFERIALMEKAEELHRLRLLEINRRFNEDEERQRQQAADDALRELQRQQDRLRQAREGIGDLVTDLTAAPGSPLPLDEALGNADRRFEELLRKGQRGNVDALEELPDAFRDLLGLARERFASSEAFFDIFTPGLEALRKLGVSPEGKPLPPGDRAIVRAIDDQTAEVVAALATLGGQGGPGGQSRLVATATAVGAGAEVPRLRVTEPATLSRDLEAFARTLAETLNRTAPPQPSLALFRDVAREIGVGAVGSSEQLAALLAATNEHLRLLRGEVSRPVKTFGARFG